MAGEVLPDRAGPVHPQDHPELEGAEAAAELHPGVHQIPHGRLLGRLQQVLRREREGLAQHVHPPAVERAEVDRREEPLVRVDHERVGAFCACQQVPMRRQQPGHATVRGVHVQPEAFALADVGDGRHRIDAGRRRRADRWRRRRSEARRPTDRPRSPAPGDRAEAGRLRRSRCGGANRFPGQARSAPCPPMSAPGPSSRQQEPGDRAVPPARDARRRARPPGARPPGRASSRSRRCRRSRLRRCPAAPSTGGATRATPPPAPWPLETCARAWPAG